MYKFLLAVFAATTLASCTGETPVNPVVPPPVEPVIPPPAPLVSLSSPSSVTLGQKFAISWHAINADSCKADWTTRKVTTGLDSVTLSVSTWLPMLCTGAGGIAKDSVFVAVVSREVLVILQYVTPEGVTYLPESTTFTLVNAGVTTSIRLKDTVRFPASAAYSDTVRFSLPGNTSYYPVFAEVPKAYFSNGQGAVDTVSIVRAPRSWTVALGTYRGQVINVSLKAGFDTAPDGGSFFSRGQPSIVELLGGYAYYAYGQDKATFPKKLVFDRTKNPSASISAQDSINYWGNVRIMEEKYGRNLFVPGMSTPGSYLNEFKVGVDSTLRSHGGGIGVDSADGSRNLVGGGIGASKPFGFTNPNNVEHEIMHGFGYDHGCSWSGIMIWNCVWTQPIVYPELAKDVAYFELNLEVDVARRKYKAKYHLAENLAGQRIELGLKPEPIYYRR